MKSNLKSLLPRTPTDTFAFCFTLSIIHVIACFGLFVLLPWVVDEYKIGLTKKILHISAVIFLYSNVMMNFWKVLTTDTSSGSAVLPIFLQPGWKFCASCEANSPPRAFHCHICRHCVLKRDHHCPFTGNCIGNTNYRFYIQMIFYFWVASVYANIMTFAFTWSILGEFSLYNLFRLVLPLLSCLLGQTDLYTFAVCVLSIMSIVGCMLLVALLSFHLGNVVRGQTTFERSHRVHTYGLGLEQNIKSVFGERWRYAWLFPSINSPLPGDGITFLTKESLEKPKDL